MTNLIDDAQVVRCDLTGAAARLAGVSTERVFAFGELSDFLKEFLETFCRPLGTFVSAGLTTPEIAIACDRAGVNLVEVTGVSPFTVDLDSTLSAVAARDNVLYIANPNRVSGACVSLADLVQLAEAVPHGFLIVDETLCDYSGITCKSVQERCRNVIILRSFTAPFGIHTTDAGFSIAHRQLNARMVEAIRPNAVSRGVRDAIVEAISDGQAVGCRRQQIHDESLRLAVDLTKLGIQCRISATDFLLMRVASPKDTGNFLTSHRVPIENLDGYPGMKNYLRYRLSSPAENDELLDAFSRMPTHYIKMPGFDDKAVRLHRRRGVAPVMSKDRHEIPRLTVNRTDNRASLPAGMGQ
ncbi:MAG: aminotransferase class I/II-fold pyridoxal phosphate-dependent enzyme [Candidatus Zixiibacteriota bacterium]|nr:MAG: aminotransferase class I/II-fold pyridoxal phosphate-dependent enzyme [candidate division Zixibacteria bacterium]